MKYFIRKAYFSMFMSLLVVLTTVTTTFAWFSTQQNVIVDTIDISIAGSGDRTDDAGIVLSIDGINFKKELDGEDMKRAVLLDRGFKSALTMSTSEINNLYKDVGFSDATPIDFKDLSKGLTGLNRYDNEPARYISFDLYVSVLNDKYVDQNGLDLFFYNEDRMAFADNISKALLLDPETLAVDPAFINHPLERYININPINAVRLGVVVYEPMTKGVISDTNMYSSNIYSFTEQSPNYDEKNNCYNFGGINEEVNMMLEYYNQIMNEKISIPEELKNREDKLIYGQEVFPSSLGCTASKMVKLKLMLWMEGWDADCFNLMIGSSSSYTIKFTNQII